MTRFITSFVLLFLASAVFSQTREEIVSPDEFERMSEGKTMYFYQNGQFYGAEQYFEGRKSVWKTADGNCQRGQWHAEGRLICFKYLDDPVTSCWNFLKAEGGFYARLLGNTSENDLYLKSVNTDTLLCPAPELSS